MSDKRKRKAGRPKVLTDADQARTLYLAPEVATERGKQNVHYRQLALVRFCNDPRFSFIADGKKMEAGEKDGFKPTILAELGRVRDDELREYLALEVCRKRMLAKDAIPYIRRVRLGKEAKPDLVALTTGIERAISNYLASRPSTPLQLIANVLTSLAESIQEDD